MPPTPVPGFYPSNLLDNWQRTMLALDIELERFHAEMFFLGDLKRIIVSPNQFAFRERALSQPWSNLMLPFMSYKRKDWQPKATRGWWSAGPALSGVWVEDLQDKLQVAPMTISYEATVFFHKEVDLQFAYDRLMWQKQSPANTIAPMMTMKSPTGETKEFPWYANVDWNPQFEPSYNEEEWLKLNKIHSMSIDFTVEALSIKSTTDRSFWPTETAVLDFASKKSLADEGSSFSTSLSLVESYFES